MRKQARKRCEGAVLVGALALVSGAAMAAVDSATVSATVVQPIAIQKTSDMSLGNLLAGNGTVTVSTGGVRSKTGGTPFMSGAPSPAKFAVSGAGNSTFSILTASSSTTLSGSPGGTMPISFIVESVGGQNASAVGKTTSDSDSALSGGHATIHVGAVVTVAADQPAGVYNGTLIVTVNYN
jgi:Mat/Ecp fimbriae major subunit